MKIFRVIICAALLVGIFALAPEAHTSTSEVKVDFNARADISPEIIRIEDGISINGIDMSGKTKNEAVDLLEAYYENIADGRLEISAGHNFYSKTYREIGFSWNYQDELDSALSLGQSVGTIKKYKALTDMHAGVMALEGSDSLDQASLMSFLRNISKECTVEPVDATLSRENKEFIVTRGRKGVRMDERATYQMVTEAIKDFPARVRVKAQTEMVEQKVPYEMLSKVKDLLGTCTTYVNGSDDRAWNVELGTSHFNGLLLMPGESCSASLQMEERTQENGYKMAGQYVDGQSVDTWGGGICQVSSTLYQALLQAEVQIDERHNHSLTVKYLDPSLDAAISWGTKDMKFTNNLEYPIFIEGWVDKERNCTFNIYGCETRPAGRTLEYVSVIEEQRYDPDIPTPSDDYPVGYEKVKGQNHPFTKSHMDKIVYMNGEQVSRETVHWDTYESSPAKLIIGTNKTMPPYVPETTAAGG